MANRVDLKMAGQRYEIALSFSSFDRIVLTTLSFFDFGRLSALQTFPRFRIIGKKTAEREFRDNSLVRLPFRPCVMAFSVTLTFGLPRQSERVHSCQSTENDR